MNNEADSTELRPLHLAFSMDIFPSDYSFFLFLSVDKGYLGLLCFVLVLLSLDCECFSCQLGLPPVVRVGLGLPSWLLLPPFGCAFPGAGLCEVFLSHWQLGKAVNMSQSFPQPELPWLSSKVGFL